MPTDAYHSVCTRLMALGGHRVWSLIVTVFGDLAAEENAVIPGAVLSELMARLDTRPEATRVALHRLRKDGWIASTKRGRQSFHGLTAYGLQETRNAGRRIYAPPAARSEAWKVVITDPTRPDPGVEMQQAGFLSFGPRQYVGPDPTHVPREALCLDGTNPPHWLRSRLGEVLHSKAYDALFETLTLATETLAESDASEPFDRAILRCLIVHNWRRLLLRHPDVAPALFPPDWRGEECRALVHILLTRFPRPDVL